MKKWTSDQVKVRASRIVTTGQMWAMTLLLSLDIEGSVFDTALADAVIYEQTTMVQMLLEKRADVNAMVVRESTRNQAVPVLYLGLRNHNIKIIRLLLAHGADINQPLQDWHRNYPTLHWAIYSGDMPLFELMLSLGANVTRNASDDWGPTPLHLAADAGNIRMAQLLLDRGASIDAQAVDAELGLTPLHWVLEGNNGDLTQSETLLMIKFLLGNGATCRLEDDWSSSGVSFAQWIIAHSARMGEEVMNVLLAWKGDAYDPLWLDLWKRSWEDAPAREYPKNPDYKPTYPHIDDGILPR